MRVLKARNAHEALALGLQTIFAEGVRRDSRNGPVLQYPTPVTTVYERPTERVVFWSQRDANPFFHLYEAMWMLAGRNDLSGLVKFNKKMADYSDDGRTVNGSAYGYRWRTAFDEDQLSTVIEMLRNSRTERRAMLQMWDATTDLGSSSKDVPCNTMASVQINSEGALDLTVFCRSNDIVWGAYGANAVHFSVLLEYLACAIGVPVGRYYQISVNWHGYLSTIEPLRAIGESLHVPSPYVHGLCEPVPLMLNGASRWFDVNLLMMLALVDNESLSFSGAREWQQFPFFHTFYLMMLAHQLWRALKDDPGRYDAALQALDAGMINVDWIRAGKEWMQRRLAKWKAKQTKEDNTCYHNTPDCKGHCYHNTPDCKGHGDF